MLGNQVSGQTRLPVMREEFTVTLVEEWGNEVGMLHGVRTLGHAAPTDLTWEYYLPYWHPEEDEDGWDTVDPEAFWNSIDQF